MEGFVDELLHLAIREGFGIMLSRRHCQKGCERSEGQRIYLKLDT